MAAVIKVTKWLCGILLAILSLAGTFAFYLGYISPAARDLALYRANVTQLVEGLLQAAPNNHHRIFDLCHPQLPNFWYFGALGICDFFTESNRLNAQGETRCRRAFPPTQNKASARLAVLSLLFDFIGFGLAPFVGARTGRAVIYLAALCSTIMAVAAGVCAVLSMNDGPHGGISGVGNVSGSLVFLFISAVLKVPAILGLSKIRGKPVKTVPLNDHPETLSRKAIGYTGEKFLYDWCQARIPDFSYGHWSSQVYRNNQNDYADFTYTDHDGFMKDALEREGVDVMPEWSTATTYHLEVKSTPADCTARPFKISQNQKWMMQDCHDSPLDAYIIVRVFHVGREDVDVEFFTHPWALKQGGIFVFGGPDKNGDIPVYIQR